MNEKPLDEQLDYIRSALDTLKARLALIQDEIEALDGEEKYFAREWWKDNKYLYHVFPSDESGYRKRVYIGCDPGRIAEARANVKRWQRHRELTQAWEKLRLDIMSQQGSVDMIAYHLQRLIERSGATLNGNGH